MPDERHVDTDLTSTGDLWDLAVGETYKALTAGTRSSLLTWKHIMQHCNGAHPTPLWHFIRGARDALTECAKSIRLVYKSEVMEAGCGYALDDYLADKAPFFYRDVQAMIEDLNSGLFRTAFQTTVGRLPTAKSFQESHFGEVVAGVFAEEVLGLRRLYSKLRLLTAENANAYKMDLVMYDPRRPIQLVFGEVKCSPKSDADGLPAGHDKACFADVFNSLREYSPADLKFDLAAAKERLAHIPAADAEDVRAALKPYSGATVKYLAFTIIDSSTYCGEEARLLQTRKSKKEFEVDLICVEHYGKIAGSVYSKLKMGA